VIVYRGVFRTILFYAALWAQVNGGVLLAGAGTAVLLLAVIAWAMLRCSRSAANRPTSSPTARG